MKLTEKTALVVGGSRGIGRELTITLAAAGAKTHALARSRADLDTLTREHPDVVAHQADASDETCAGTHLSAINPDLLILCLGATPKMTPFHTQNWSDFSAAWNTDVRAAFSFMSAALTQPMRPGSTVVSFSSGAGLSGSRLSGGYAGAKRMQHFLSDYAQREADSMNLGLRFLSVIPKQLVQGTEKGQSAAAAYAEAAGKPIDEFWRQWPQPLTAEAAAEAVLGLVQAPAPWPSHSFAITGAGAEPI